MSGSCERNVARGPLTPPLAALRSEGRGFVCWAVKRLYPRPLLSLNERGGEVTATWHAFCESANELAAWDESDVAQGLGILLEDDWEMQPALGMVVDAIKCEWTVNEFAQWYREVRDAMKRGETSGVVLLPLSGPFAWSVKA